MSAKDLQNFRYLLGQMIRAERWPRRQLERRLGLGHKNLEKLLDGTMETRLRHILAVAEWLGVRPGELVDLGCPETAAAARRKVADVLIDQRGPGRGEEPPGGEPE
jgi:DNA-binding Xre family transcriptional regulator